MIIQEKRKPGRPRTITPESQSPAPGFERLSICVPPGTHDLIHTLRGGRGSLSGYIAAIILPELKQRAATALKKRQNNLEKKGQ